MEQTDLAADTTLPAGCYSIAELLQISNRLDIEAGAELRFATSAGLAVDSTGVLAAAGTVDMPVMMTATDTTWLGVRFVGSASSENRLENTVIEAAEKTGIQLDVGARLTVSSSTIRGAGEVGISAPSGSELEVTATTFSANALPMSVGIDLAGGIGADNIFDGNSEQIVQVEFGALSEPARWSALPVPYRLTGDASVESALTLDPGVVIEMPQGAGILVRTTGSLTAAGSTDAPITIHGVQDERGYWMGISFASKTSDNVLSDCVVANGGSGRWNGASEAIGMIWLERQGKVQVSGCTLRDSDGPAVATLDEADLTGFANNAIEGNRSTIHVDPTLVHHLEPSNTFTGNDEQFIRVSRISALQSDSAIAEPATWPRHPIPYRILRPLFVDSAWTIEAGVEIEVAQDADIRIQDTGSIKAVGTTTEPIIFRGVEALQGYWKGIGVWSQSTDNVLDFVEVRHGGSSRFNGNPDSQGLLFISAGSLTVSNAILSDSGGYGATVFSGGALLGCTDVTFSGNSSMDVFVDANGSISACP